MSVDQLPVEVDQRFVIDRSEMQQDLFVLPAGWNLQRALIPHGIDKIGVFHPTQFTFGTEGNGDLAFEAGGLLELTVESGLAKVECVAPGTIQVLPFGTFKLGTRILRSGSLLSHG